MKTVRYSETEKKENPHGVDLRPLYNKESAQVMHMILLPNEALKPHITPVDVFFYILEGNPTIHVGEEHESFEKDTLIESPAGIVHYISNNSDVPARILVVKAPRPEKASKML